MNTYTYTLFDRFGRNPGRPRSIRRPVARALLSAAFLACFALAAGGVRAQGDEPQVGRPAPEFAAKDSKGTTRHLSDFRGKPVVLEWTNADCPYTRKHYSSGNMQGVQALARKNGVIWLSVISSAPGKQGYVNGPAADALTQSRSAVPTAVLLDSSGAVGRLYHARTTPHMFVIDENGILQYMGGMDSIATADTGDIDKAEPYLKEAMLAVVERKPVAHAVTKPYGCGVKY
ncbi:MAG: thioredoxin family protein [Gammaproteobacteria bacterium]|nr:thioredoxin family protein [Gammaproteobacteria bacterium]